MLLEARKVKAAKRGGIRTVYSCQKKRVVFFEKLDTLLVAGPQVWICAWESECRV